MCFDLPFQCMPLYPSDETERCQIGNRARLPAAGSGKIKGAGLEEQAARETRRNRAGTCRLHNKRACRRGGAGDRKQPAA